MILERRQKTLKNPKWTKATFIIFFILSWSQTDRFFFFFFLFFKFQQQQLTSLSLSLSLVYRFKEKKSAAVNWTRSKPQFKKSSQNWRNYFLKKHEKGKRSWPSLAFYYESIQLKCLLFVFVLLIERNQFNFQFDVLIMFFYLFLFLFYFFIKLKQEKS